MSRSPERMSSYRRHFEGTLEALPAYQIRVSSPSPTRRETRRRSASFTRSDKTMGLRATSKSGMTRWVTYIIKALQGVKVYMLECKTYATINYLIENHYICDQVLVHYSALMIHIGKVWVHRVMSDEQLM